MLQSKEEFQEKLLTNLQFEIFTLSKYENFVKKRPDLFQYIDKVNFLNEEKDLIKKVDYINIARNPESQYQFLIYNKPYSYKHLYLEKPIAHQTMAYSKCIENFEIEKTSFSVFYSLNYMDWYNNIIEEMVQEVDQKFEIVWKIKQKSSSWKQDISRGGGMLFKRNHSRITRSKNRNSRKIYSIRFK